MSFKNTRLACYASSVIQAAINNFLPLLFVMFSKDYGITLTQLSFTIMLNFSVQLTVDVASIKIVSKLGTRKTIVLAHFCGALGLVLLGVLPKLLPSAFLGICISIVFTSICGGFIEVLTSPLMTRISEGKGRAFMSFLHSFYCWGHILVVVITTVIIKLFGYGVWQYMALGWAVVPLINGIAFMRVPVVEDKPQEERTPLGELFRKKAFILLIVLMLAAGASELAMAQWASTFAENGLGLDKLTGDLLGPCAFAFFMGLGRILSALIGDKISIRKMLFFCSAIAVVCYLVAAFSDNSIVAVCACALCGLGVSVLWPGVCSLASERFDGGGNAMFGMLAMAGDMGCIIGPFITGALADSNGFAFALAVSAAFPLLSLITLLSKSFRYTK